VILVPQAVVARLNYYDNLVLPVVVRDVVREEVVNGLVVRDNCEDNHPTCDMWVAHHSLEEDMVRDEVAPNMVPKNQRDDQTSQGTLLDSPLHVAMESRPNCDHAIPIRLIVRDILHIPYAAAVVDQQSPNYRIDSTMRIVYVVQNSAVACCVHTHLASEVEVVLRHYHNYSSAIQASYHMAPVVRLRSYYNYHYVLNHYSPEQVLAKKSLQQTYCHLDLNIHVLNYGHEQQHPAFSIHYQDLYR
jgi:hypothetical protein